MADRPVIVVLVGCAALVLTSICVIVLLALLGPTVGNVFSNIIISI